MLVLETPSERLRTAFVEMAMDFKAHGNSRYVQDADDFAGFLTRVVEEAEGRNLAPGRVPSRYSGSYKTSGSSARVDFDTR